MRRPPHALNREEIILSAGAIASPQLLILSGIVPPHHLRCMGIPVVHESPGVGIADIYRIPDGKKRAAVLLFLGANAAGRDDKDVVKLGDALPGTVSRSG